MSSKMDKEISELLLKNAFEEFENARCDEIIEKYKDTEPEYSEEHKRRMEKLFKKEKKSFCWSKFAKRAAMVILAVFLSGALALQVEAVRIKIENWYYEITGEALHLGESYDNLPSYSDSEVFTLPEEIVCQYNFNLIQEINEKFIMSNYENINGTYIKCLQYFEKRNVRLDNDTANLNEIILDGKTVIIINNINKTSLYWEDKENYYCVHTNINEEEIVEIIKNVIK